MFTHKSVHECLYQRSVPPNYPNVHQLVKRSWKHYAKYKKPFTKGTHIEWLYLQAISRAAKSIQTESRVVVVENESGIRRRRRGCWEALSILGATAVFSHRLWWSPQHQTPTFSIVKKKSLEVYVCIKRVNSIVCAFLSVVLQPITWKDTHLHS